MIIFLVAKARPGKLGAKSGRDNPRCVTHNYPGETCAGSLAIPKFDSMLASRNNREPVQQETGHPNIEYMIQYLYRLRIIRRAYTIRHLNSKENVHSKSLTQPLGVVPASAKGN